MGMEALDLENRIDEAASRETQARASLGRWLGVPVKQPLADAPDFSVLPHDKSALLSSVDQQGNLLDWPAREHVAEAALEEAKAEKHSEWSVGLSYGSRVRGLSDMVTVQVGVSLPLFARNRQDHGISARGADLDAVRSEHDDARRQQVEALQAAWAQWDALGRQVRRHLDQLLPQANDRAAMALASYRGGGDFQPLLDARGDEISHHTDFARMALLPEAQFTGVCPQGSRRWIAVLYRSATSIRALLPLRPPMTNIKLIFLRFRSIKTPDYNARAIRLAMALAIPSARSSVSTMSVSP
jgi:hypothetical protein